MRQIRAKHSTTRRHKPGVRQCLILAAGNGRRLISVSGGSPKPLVHLHGRSLLEHVILRAREAGIDRFVIVVGYGADAMREWIDDCALDDVSIDVVDNYEYQKDNGVFLLLMADHIFEPRTAKALLEEPLIEGEVILAIDPKIDQVFDLDDATKVRREGDRIVDIGKQIIAYDAFDTGMFLCSQTLFDVLALESTRREGNCSLSDGMRLLGRTGRLRAFDIGDAAWQDVDTPEALAHAESIYNTHFCPTPASERFTSA
jgi:choline kinase